MAQKMRADGFAFEDARTILEQVGSSSEWVRFSDAWERLPLDRYLREGHHFRRRRYGRFRSSIHGGVVPRSHGPYYQTQETNRYAGGICRHYSEIEQEVWRSRIFRNLVRLDTAVVSRALSHFDAWNVDIHMFRIESEDDKAAPPTPEGVHRDGNAAFAVHMVNYQCRGGVTTLFRGTMAVQSKAMIDRAETLFVDDRRMMHDVSEIRAADGQPKGVRDVMIVDFYS